MTLPLSGSPVTENYTRLWSAIASLQSDCLRIQSDIAAGPCSLQWFGQLAQDILQFNKIYDQCTATQELANSIIDWAQQQSPGTVFSGTDFVATHDAAQALLARIEEQYPTSNGFLADRRWNSTDGIVWSTTTAGEVPAIMSAITTFLATLS
jgi:hypothetical protein